MSERQDTITVEYTIGGGSHPIRGTLEIDREEWEDMDDKQRNDLVFELMFSGEVEWSYEVCKHE